MRLRVCVCALICNFIALMSATAQQQTTVPVGTLAAERRPVTRTTEFVGRVEAMARVEIRARVTGFLEDVLFKEGEVVNKGDVLYKIEPDTFQAAVQQSQGALLEAQAKYANATVQRGRTQSLVATDTASRALLDERVANEKGAQGEVMIADANLKTATVNLGYTTITAPITGEVGRTKYTVGNVVKPDSESLTLIVSRDPMYVVFPVSQREFLKVQEQDERRERQETLGVRIRFSDGTTYDQTGRINFVDVSVDRATDTVIVRATVPNPKGKLIDGQLVRVSVEADKPDEKVVVPQSALVVDQQGTYVFLIVDGKAAVRRVKLGAELGPSVIVNDGLEGGEQVVVEGVESLRPGTSVVATPAKPPQSGN